MNEEFNWSNAPTICELNGYRWLLGPQAEETMDWHDAKDWCKSQGGILPPREVLLMSYVNQETKGSFANDFYWSSSEGSSDVAWVQYFYSGYQDFSNKHATNIRVRAVKATIREIKKRNLLQVK